jgi:1-acyl-sn-glycerol-3-phosphate acyltransferase
VDGSIGPFKKGSHLLAQRANVPMVPITIIGTRNIIRKGSILIHPGPVKIIISPKVTLLGKDREKGDDILQDIRNTICDNFKNYQTNFTKDQI